MSDSNEIEIVVRGRDDSGTALAAADAKAKKFKGDVERMLNELNAKKLRIDADVIAAEQKLTKLREQAKTATGDAKIKIDADIAAADAKLKVMRDQADDLAKRQTVIRVQVDADIAAAQQKLADLKTAAADAAGDVKVKADADVTAAEAKLADLQRLADRIDGKTVNIDADVDKAKAESGLHQLEDAASKSGMASSASFSRNFSSGLMPGLIAAGALLSGPLIAAVAGAITAGGVVGVAGLGGYLQKGDPAVEKAGTSLGRTFVNGFEQASAGLAGPVAHALDMVKAGLVRDLPQIRKAFDTVGQFIAPLTEGFIGLAHNALPGFVHMLQAAGPVIDVIAKNLPVLGSEIGNLLATFGNLGPEVAMALDDVMAVVIGLIEVFRRVAIAGAGMTDIFHGDVSKGLKLLQDALDPTKVAADGVTGSSADLARSFTNLDGAAKAVKKSMRQLADELLEQRADQRGYEAAIDAATEALKRNGRTLNVHTAKGRENQAALDDIASSALRWRDAVAKAGGSQAAQNRILETARDRLMKTARQMGLTAGQARNLANALLGIPRSITVTVTTRYRQDRQSTYNQQVPYSARNAQAHGGIVGGVGRAAEGGPRNGWTDLAEQGRELVEIPAGAGPVALPAGSRVWSNPDTERMLAGAGRAGAGLVQLNVYAPIGSQSQLEDWLQQAVNNLKRKGRL